ncbi:MAG: PocR ligand-binding domain-containing protein [Nitrospirota bacterium]|nr:PocR ligand-binding domain-containing protein [Nitrospirota bacterium]
MKLTDILPVEKWTELEKDIYERSGLASNVFDVEGTRITDFKVWVNRLCPVVKADDRGQSFICAVAHMNIADMARKSRGPVIETCDAGLVKLVVPVFARGEFVGAVGACGLLLGDDEVDAFMVNRTLEISEEKIEALSGDIKRITSENAAALGEYIKERIADIVSGIEKENM